MSLENPTKPKPETAKTVELTERVRNAAALKFAKNLTDAQLAEIFNISVNTVPDWKKHPAWVKTVSEISAAQFAETFEGLRAAAPAARETLLELMRDGPPALRAKIAMMVCVWAVKGTDW